MADPTWIEAKSSSCFLVVLLLLLAVIKDLTLDNCVLVLEVVLFALDNVAIEAVFAFAGEGVKLKVDQ